MNSKQKRKLIRIIVAIVLFAVAELLPYDTLFPEDWALYGEFIAFLIPFILAGYDVVAKAIRGITRGHMLDENFLMTVASLGAFALVLFPHTEPHMAEGAAVMIFYQVGEWFEGYAVGRSRKSIAAMMDIAPDFANLYRNGEVVEVDPEEVSVGDTILVRPGERIPVDGTVLEGDSSLDTAALTGESLPRSVCPGDEVISGCINLNGALKVRATKPYSDSTVSRILELVENAAEKKAPVENFITRFARIYTPIVVGAAILLAVVPPLIFAQPWADWITRGLIFLVVSCPCALVISVPLSFFGGIGGASRRGILVKGGNYLEALASVDTVAFDKTGTLTNGTFEVVGIHSDSDHDADALLHLAAHAESHSTHPIAHSVIRAYPDSLNPHCVTASEEIGGHGIRALVDGRWIAVGNERLMEAEGIEVRGCSAQGTVLHIAVDGSYGGHIVVADTLKADAATAIADLKAAGIERVVMLSGDRSEVALAIAEELGIDEVRSQLLPQDKVEVVEDLLATEAPGKKVAFVGDGINDAPVLTRADVGIAMGAMGSDAAIEAADVVLMNDRPSDIAQALTIARKTMAIVRQNIVFALGVKFAVLALAVLGFATMWLAVFADVGVACIAILNAMRAMRTRA